jgi:hypothetical protein
MLPAASSVNVRLFAGVVALAAERSRSMPS